MQVIHRDLCRCYNREELDTLFNMIMLERTYFYQHLLDCYNITYEELKELVSEMHENEL